MRELKTNRIVVALGAALSLVLAGHAAQDPQEPAFRADAVVVTVDVVVRDRRGNLVTDLTADDFTVRESGVRQRILSFVAPRAAAGAAARSSANDPAREVGELTDSRDLRAPSVVVLAFDRLSPQAQAMAVEAARTYVGHHAQTDDVVGIFSIDNPVRTIQPFTRDGTLLLAALDHVQQRGATTFGDPRERINQLSSILRRDASGVASSLVGLDAASNAEGLASPSGRTGGPPEDLLLRMELRMLQSSERMDRHIQGETATQGLRTLVDALRLTPGRKTVVLFSEGLALPDPVRPRFETAIDEANLQNVTFYAVDAQGLRARSEQGRTREDLTAASSDSLLGGREAVQLRDLERTEDTLRSDPSSSLSRLTKSTGGTLIQNTNDLGRAFSRLADDMRGHYLLSYSPADTNWNGAFRPIRVEVSRRGLAVQARRGYLAVPPAAILPQVNEVFIVDWAETRAETTSDAQHPLQFGNVVLYPNLGQPVSKRASATLAFAFIVETGGRAVDAQLELRRDGQPTAAVVLPLDEPDRDGRIRQVSRLPIGTLEQGTYELRIVVRAGSLTAARSAQVMIVP